MVTLMLSQMKPGDQVFWPKVVLKKWLNLRSKDSKFNTVDDENDDGGDQGICGYEANGGGAEIADEQEENCGCDSAATGVEIAGADERQVDAAPYKLRRRNSETMHAQYINTNELRICIGTYNTAGKSPPEGLDIADAEWLGSGDEQADMYVLGFQEVVPLNAGIVFGAEDGRPALAWEDLIRDTLTRKSTPSRPKYRYRSNPVTPNRDGAAEPFPGGADTETDDDTPFSLPAQAEKYVASASRKLGAVDDPEAGQDDQDQHPGALQQRTLLKTMSNTDRIGLASRHWTC